MCLMTDLTKTSKGFNLAMTAPDFSLSTTKYLNVRSMAKW